MAARAYLKNEFTEDKKCQNLILIICIYCISVSYILTEITSAVPSSKSDTLQQTKLLGSQFHNWLKLHLMFFFFFFFFFSSSSSSSSFVISNIAMLYMIWTLFNAVHFNIGKCQDLFSQVALPG